MFAYTMEQNPSCEAVSSSATQKIAFYVVWKFIAKFMGAHPCTLSWL